MAGLGWQELVIVLVIIMIIFGAGKLPEVARSVGQGVKEFREEAQAPVVPTSATTVPSATRTTPHSNASGAGVVADVRTDDVGDTIRTERARA